MEIFRKMAFTFDNNFQDEIAGIEEGVQIYEMVKQNWY